MQGHATGNFRGSRLGPIEVRKHFLFCSTGVANGNVVVSGTNQKLCTLPATTFQPVLYSVKLIEIAANTAAGAVTASVGTASAGTQLLNAVDLKAAAGTNYVTAPVEVYSEVDVAIWLNYTVASGTDASSKFVIEVTSREVNVNAPNNQEA